MKRKLSITNFNINATENGKVKRESVLNSRKLPSFYIAKNAPALNDLAALIIQSIWKRHYDKCSLMDTDMINSGLYVFLFFLDAQGKEQMSSIREMIKLFLGIAAIFISLNISIAEEETSSSITSLNTKECKSLSRQLCLLDPLGGGEYPVNYLIIMDKTQVIRYQAPLKFSHCYSAYQKFGLQPSQLHGIIEEYSNFATNQV